MAEGIAAYLPAAERYTLSKMVLSSRYVAEGNLAGAHRSPQRGASSEFADHQAYIQGDDPKHIDWKVLGRTDRYYIRRYEDETNLRVYLVVDRSASMGYGSQGTTKYRYACHLAAALGYVVVKDRDSAGLFLVSNKVDVVMPPRNSFLHLNNILKRIRETSPASTTEIGATFHQVADSVGKRALIIVLSDLFGVPAELDLTLAHFRRQKNDVIVFHVLDPAEIDLPFTKPARFKDMETGEIIRTDPRALAESYRKTFGEFIESCRSACARRNIDYRLTRTDQSVLRFASAYLQERRRLSG